MANVGHCKIYCSKMYNYFLLFSISPNASIGKFKKIMKYSCKIFVSLIFETFTWIIKMWIQSRLKFNECSICIMFRTVWLKDSSGKRQDLYQICLWFLNQDHGLIGLEKNTSGMRRKVPSCFCGQRLWWLSWCYRFALARVFNSLDYCFAGDVTA